MLFSLISFSVALGHGADLAAREKLARTISVSKQRKDFEEDSNFLNLDQFSKNLMKKYSIKELRFEADKYLSAVNAAGAI